MRTVIGVDASSTRLAAVGIVGTSIHTATLKLPSDITDACSTAYSWMQNVAGIYKPRLIALEAPFIHQKHPSGAVPMAQVNGALLAALSDHRSISVQPSHWKKSVIGIGNASKEIIAEWVNAKHPDVHARFATDKMCQDLLDAFCVALHALRVLETRDRLLVRNVS